MNVLKLTVSKKPFELMSRGKKQFEVRRPSKWILSRLIDKNGNAKNYDYVEFRNGYAKNAPSFMVKYKGFVVATKFEEHLYPNGLIVEVNQGDIKILLGDKLE